MARSPPPFRGRGLSAARWRKALISAACGLFDRVFGAFACASACGSLALLPTSWPAGQPSANSSLPICPRHFADLPPFATRQSIPLAKPPACMQLQFNPFHREPRCRPLPIPPLCHPTAALNAVHSWKIPDWREPNPSTARPIHSDRNLLKRETHHVDTPTTPFTWRRASPRSPHPPTFCPRTLLAGMRPSRRSSSLKPTLAVAAVTISTSVDHRPDCLERQKQQNFAVTPGACLCCTSSWKNNQSAPAVAEFSASSPS